MIYLLPIIGGIISAWHGGRIYGGVTKGLKNLIWTAPFTIAAWWYLPFWTIPLTALCVLKGMGHGRIYRPFEPLDLTKEPEKIEKYIIGKLQGRIPDWVYKSIGMALVGLAAVSGAVIAFGLINPMAGIVIALGGLFKGVNALMFSDATEVREYADGVAAYSGLMVGIILC